MKIEMNAHAKDFGLWLLGFLFLGFLIVLAVTSTDNSFAQHQKIELMCVNRGGDYVLDTYGRYRCEGGK